MYWLLYAEIVRNLHSKYRISNKYKYISSFYYHLIFFWRWESVNPFISDSVRCYQYRAINKHTRIVCIEPSGFRKVVHSNETILDQIFMWNIGLYTYSFQYFKLMLQKFHLGIITFDFHIINPIAYAGNKRYTVIVLRMQSHDCVFAHYLIGNRFDRAANVRIYIICWSFYDFRFFNYTLL